MGKIKTIIIDDEPKAIDVLARYCKELDQIILIGQFRDPLTAIEFIKANAIDLLLLDINLPKLSGMQLLQVIESNPKVIFTTAYSEFALESYEYDAVDYLLKPITLSRFIQAINKVERLLDPLPEKISSQSPTSEKTIFVKSGAQIHKIQTVDILYLEKDGNYLIYHTLSKKVLSRQNMKDVFEFLEPEKFLRIHKSFVVAKKHIEIIEPNQIKIHGRFLPIGRNYKQNLSELLK